MSIAAKKIMMGSGAVALPSDDQFNRTSFLSHFDGSNDGVNNQFTDGSASNHTITANGNVTQGSFGPFARPDGEWGVSFDGDDYLTVAETGADEFTFGTGDFTIEGWINNQAVDASQSRTIISTAQGNDFQGIWFGINGGKYYYIYNNSGAWSVIVDAGTPVANAWTHFALVRNGTSNVVYINGSSIGSTTETARDLTNTNNLLAIGGRATSSQYTISTMSNVRVVKGTAVYTGNFTPSTSKLTAITNTKLLTCQSNRFVDNSASPLTITPVGNPAVSAFGPFLTSTVYDPAVNGASSQLGATNSVEIATGTWAQLGTGDFTWEYWIYPIASNNYHLGSGTSGQNLSSTFTLGMSNKQLILYYTADGTAAHLLATSGAPEYNLNEWHHLAYVRAGNVHKIYANGILATSETRSGAMANSTGPTIIGQYGTGSGIYGYGAEGIYCDVRLVKGTAVYSGSTYTVPTAPLTAISGTELLLNFKNGQAIDSAAQNNLTLFGTAKTSTAQKKFGTASLLLDGNSDYATFRENGGNDIDGGGNWTVEFFWRFVNKTSPSTQEIISKGIGFQLYTINGSLGFALSANNSGTYFINSPGGTTLDNDTWYHIALVKNGTSYKLYLNGTSDLSATSSSNIDTGGYPWFLGTLSGAESTYASNGYMDEVRISKFARYTSNFTAPTEPFADKGQ